MPTSTTPARTTVSEAATVVMTRRELEFSASGLMGAQYPPEYVKHHIDRLHTRRALRLLDLELSGPDEILPGILCEMTGGHTEGSMNILVETADGTACLCGDIMYDVHNAVVEPYHVSLDCEPQVTGNHALTKRHEKAAIKRALNSGRYILTGHDYPAIVEHGRVVERMAGARFRGRASRSPIGRRRTSSRLARDRRRSAIHVSGQSRHCARPAGEAGKLGSR